MNDLHHFINGTSVKVVGRKEGLPELERLEIVLARASRSKTKPCDVLAELIHDTLEET